MVAVLAWAVFLMLGAALMAAAEDPGAPTEPWVANVNGDPISVRLFERRLMRNRSSAYRYFAQRYGVSDSADFWTTLHDGETPLDWLKKRTLADCVRIAIEQSLARQHGLLTDVSYSAFLRAFERENERRRKAIAAGEPIYGPQQYGEDEYFSYVFTNMVIGLKRRMQKAELEASDEMLRQQYEREKGGLYNRGDRVVVWAVGLRFGGNAGQALSREAARNAVEELRAKLASRTTSDEVRAAVGPDALIEQMTFDDESARLDDRIRPAARGEAMKLSAGQISAVFQERGAFWVIKCVSRAPLGYRPFEEVKDNVRSRYVDEKYEALVTDLVSRATVEINRDVYEAVQAR